MEEVVNRRDLAVILSISPQHVNRLVTDGILYLTERNQYNVADSVRRYVEYKVALEKKKHVSDDNNIASVRMRREIAEAELKEIQLDREKKTVVETKDVERFCVDLVSNAKSKLLAIPGKISPELEGETAKGMQAILKGAINEVLTELAAVKNLAYTCLLLALPLFQSIYAAFSPPPSLTVSQWADRHRVLSSESSAEPGRWRTSRAEYQRGIMDAFHETDIDTIIIQSSSQVGKTEMLNNIVGYLVKNDPAPMLVVAPTRELAHSWSKDRFSKMVRDTPELSSLISSPRSKNSENTILHKGFPGGHITMTGANSPSGLAARPIRFVLCDEVDRYPASAGSEGDPVGLAVKRSQAFWNRLVLLVSTPTIKDVSRIEAAFLESDQRYFHVPCPDCQKEQILKFSNIVWVDGDPETAMYRCEFCGSRWSDPKKKSAVKKGVWRKTNPGKGSVAGFHLSELYSPWSTLPNIAFEFMRSKGNPDRMQVFVNTVLGETYEDRSQKVDEQSLLNRKEKYVSIPHGGVVLTCGVDVQDDRIEGEVVAWGKDDESWSIEYFVIYGNLATAAPWDDLYDKLSNKYKHAAGIELKISCTCIDSGGHYTSHVYRFCAKHQSERIYAVKGSSTIGQPIISKGSRNNKYGCMLFLVGTDTAKQVIFSRLKIIEPGAGYMHFPEKYGEEYFRQLTAEKAVIKYVRGYPKRVWVKTRQRNDALDCRVYATAGHAILNPAIEKIAIKLFPESPKKELPEKQSPKEKRKSRHGRGGWLNSWKG